MATKDAVANGVIVVVEKPTRAAPEHVSVALVIVYMATAPSHHLPQLLK
jgi:hypothetical protein